MEKIYAIGPGEIFTLFFITLGPLRILAPFAKQTQPMTDKDIHKVAWQALLIAAMALLVCGFIGKTLLEKWNIPVAILALTGGLIFFYVAFTMIVKPKSEEAFNASTKPTGLGTALSMLITPYGAAVLIVLLAMGEGDMQREALILSMLMGVLLLDFLALFFIHQIMNKIVVMSLQLLGVVLGVLQAALALNLIHFSLKILYP